MMDLEKLKCCAEAVGETVYEFDGCLWLYENPLSVRYDPEHNDAQAFELLKWLLDRDWQLGKVNKGYSFGKYVKIDGRYGDFWKSITGQTLNQAVIEAVCEVKK